MNYWDRPLPCVITPASGPLPPMATLLDANRSLTGNLPPGYLKRAYWLSAGQALVAAAESGESAEIDRAYLAIIAALVSEGWMIRGIARTREVPSTVSSSVADGIPRPPPEPLWRRIQPNASDRRTAH
jgi:hypothetical protein